MISDNFFKEINFINYPKKKKLVLFSCNDVYFKNYGYYNLISCLRVGHSLHVHIINPENLLDFKKFDDEKLSISYEYIDSSKINSYQLKTYYYCSRFIIANYLFEKFEIDSCLITDADVFFNQQVEIDDSIKLGLMYNPEESIMWRKVSAPIAYFTRQSKQYLESVIAMYIKKVNETDFSILEKINDKYERGNILGLDQVCLAQSLNQEILKDNFLNLNLLKNLASKKEKDSKIWIITKGNLKNDPNFKIRLEDKIREH